VINKLRLNIKFEVVALVGDWHPKDHISFISRHAASPDALPFHPLKLDNGSTQVLLPVHCVAGTIGADWYPFLTIEATDTTIRKGIQPDIDHYSAFFDEKRANKTDLEDILDRNNISEVYVCGVGPDTPNTALDSAALGFTTYLVEDGVAVAPPDAFVRAKAKLEQANVAIVSSSILMEKREDRRKEGALYLQRHNIHNLLQRLCTSLVYNKPDDPRAFLIKQLQLLQNDKQSNNNKLSCNSLFTEQDFETMFKMMDPLNKGTLSSKQVSKGLEELGLGGRNVKVIEGVNFTLDQFIKLCVEASVNQIK